MQDNKELFEQTSIPKAVAKMAIPCIITSLVIVIYNMADTFFVGQTNDVNQVAAVSLTTPIFMMLMAVANILGVGGSAAIATALGAGNKKRAKNMSAFCSYASIFVGVVFTVIVLIFLEPILKALGTSENTYTFAKEYTIVIAIGAMFVLFSTALSNVVRAEGAANESMIGSMIGTIVNIVLDPVFILLLGMGTKGAAIATIIGNVAGSIYFIWYMLRKSKNLSVRISDFKVRDGIGTGVIAVGLPTGITSVLMSVVTILLNVCLVSYGDNPVAAWGVASKANMLIIFIQMGIGNGVQSLLAYSYGAGNYRRFKGLLKFSMICTFIVGTILTIPYMLASESIVKVFINDAAIMDDGAMMLRAVSLSGPVMGVLFLCINSMQAMGKALPATILSICRQGVIYIPLLYILNTVWGLQGIIYTQTVSDFITIIAAFITLIIVLEKTMKETK